jgi:DNA-binding response OmpR family regulator
LRSILPQLILFDSEMPVMDGWEFCAALQKDATLAPIPIGVMSSVPHWRPAESMHVLSKPIDLGGDTCLA